MYTNTDEAANMVRSEEKPREPRDPSRTEKDGIENSVNGGEPSLCMIFIGIAFKRFLSELW